MDIYTKIIDMPNGLRGYSELGANDEGYIVINAKLSKEMQFEVYLHELEHFLQDDFSEGNADKIELIRHTG